MDRVLLAACSDTEYPTTTLIPIPTANLILRMMFLRMLGYIDRFGSNSTTVMVPRVTLLAGQR